MSPEEALEKMKNWCAYQERSQFDVRKKLYAFKLQEEECEQIIAQLIEENFLNEERFALAFAGGKFRIKHWGKHKIKTELKKHRVSEYCINKALAGLGDENYEAGMVKLLEKKISTSKQSDRRKLYYSVMKYAVSKGYESDKVSKQLNKLIEDYSYES
ncbi:MAG: RecX family transcriptional regulator [Bacteroidia bacterium]|nr:RecX family transcriptional regulator [Bacteroidia bacterium]